MWLERRNIWIFWISFTLLIIGLFLLELRAFTRDYTNPPVVQEPNWDSPYTRELAERACFDCHSNETEWPWYAYVFPISTMLEHDVRIGREVLNFSEWNLDEKPVQVEEIVETISKGQMPLPYFVVLHPEAELTDIEKGLLINGLIATIQKGEDAPPLQAEEIDEGEDAAVEP